MSFEKTIKILAIIIIILLCFEFSFAYFIKIKNQEQEKSQKLIKDQLKQELQDKLDINEQNITTSNATTTIQKSQAEAEIQDPRTRPIPEPIKR